MPIANDLQNIIGDVSAAIAKREVFGRTELEKLRRSLDAAAREAGRDERAQATTRTAFEQLCDGIDTGVANLTGLARHAREQAQPVGGR